MLMGAGLIGASVVIQAAFMLAGLRALERLRTKEREFEHHHATLIIVLFVLFMFLAVVIDVWMWAAVYLAVGAVSSFEAALYFSTGHLYHRWLRRYSAFPRLAAARLIRRSQRDDHLWLDDRAGNCRNSAVLLVG
jgi:hypothetical protein